MSVRVGGKPLPRAHETCELFELQNFSHSKTAFFVSESTREFIENATLVPSVTWRFGPFGTIASPKSMPAPLKPLVIHGPTTSIAAFFDRNRLSASAPARPIGEMCLLITSFAHWSTALIVAGLASIDLFPSFETRSPPFPQIRIGHIGIVAWSAIA